MLLPVWSVSLALIVLLPLLGPGFVLHLDMVFVPSQTLLPWNLGIGAGLPRSVPQDAIVSLIAGPLPGQILQKVVLVASLVLAGIGAGRLAGPGLRLQIPAAALYLWSAYLAARLLMGHWSLLWGFALLPWVVLAARRARRKGQWLPVATLTAASAIVPTAGVFAAAVAIPLSVGFGSRLNALRRVALVGWVILANAPWWLAALRSSSRAVSDPIGLEVFGARADGVGPVLLSLLAGGGVWNSDATLGSRTTWFVALAVLVLVGLTLAGWWVWRRESAPEALVLLILGLLGVTWAWLSAGSGQTGWAQEVVSTVPGGGLLRDAQKWTVWWVLLLAVCAPRGLPLLMRRADRGLRIYMAGALAVLPLAMMPDLAVGAFGRLQPSNYPAAWADLRSTVATASLPGDVVSLPWSPYRRYDWNHSDVVLDPLPRYLTRTVVWNDTLPVGGRDALIQVEGDDPRAREIGDVINSGASLPARLAELGIGWIVVQTDQPVPTRAVNLLGATKIWEEEALQLWRVESPITAWNASDSLLVVVDSLVLVLFLGIGARWLFLWATRPKP